MNYQEAIKIAEMCRPDQFGKEYPPTNPAVLLEAARIIYLRSNNSKAVEAVIVWLACVLGAHNTPFNKSGAIEEPSWLIREE